MELVLGTHHLLAFGGADTYLMTIAEQLTRLGHGVTIHALEQGETADVARSRGLVVARSRRELPEAADGLIAQDAVTAYELADRYPAAPLLFVAHSEMFSLDTPPQLPGVTSAVVAMSDRVARHVASMSLTLPVIRLRQPIDTARFAPVSAPRPVAERAAVIGNYLDGPRLDLLLAGLRGAGLEVSRHGGSEPPTSEPEHAIARADLVVGKGRVVLEAMACGRAAFVYDFVGSDGWVTAERYPEMEADAFAGLAVDEPVDAARLERELAGYDPAMGLVNRDLAVAHHGAREHVQELVGALEAHAGAEPRPRGPADELAHLVRREWLADSSAYALRRENQELRGALDYERDRADDLERQAKDAYRQLEELRATRRYRVAGALGRLPDRLRRR
ncbi:MAG: hypothetical protein ACR2NH_05955 [Solirubrobacteraceae bacterium]